MTDSTTLTCRLAGLNGAQTLRYQELRKAMKASAVESRELPDGYGMRFVPEPVVFTQLAEWITLERVCCPFLAFGLEWSVSDGLWLKLTGGPDVKEFLRAQPWTPLLTNSREFRQS